MMISAQANRGHPLTEWNVRSSPEIRTALFGELLLNWFARNARDYPWRRMTEPYKVFAAEFMLQRTTPGHVVPVYEEFLRRYPTLGAAAAAPDEEFFEVLRPLGLGRRAPLFKKALETVDRKFGGRIPEDPDGLMRLPGVGPYTARAVLCFAFGWDAALVDVNVLRVLGRVFGLTSTKKRPHTDVEVWRMADAMVPRGRSKEFNLALIDLAATVCRKKVPRCGVCPVSKVCNYYGREGDSRGVV